MIAYKFTIYLQCSTEPQQLYKFLTLGNWGICFRLLRFLPQLSRSIFCDLCSCYVHVKYNPNDLPTLLFLSRHVRYAKQSVGSELMSIQNITSVKCNRTLHMHDKKSTENWNPCTRWQSLASQWTGCSFHYKKVWKYHSEYLLLGNSGDMSLPVMFWDDGRVEGKGKDETGDYTIRGNFK